MNKQLTFKLTLDFIMTALMLTAFAYQLTGNLSHEVIGVIIFLMDIIQNSKPNEQQAASATQITMTVGDKVISAVLDNSQTNKDFLSLLPLTLSMSQWGGREYYGRLPKSLSEDGGKTPDFQNGDVTFYPPSGSLAIFFAKEDTSNQAGLVRMGKITSDLSAFDGMGDSVEMRIEIKP